MSENLHQKLNVLLSVDMLVGRGHEVDIDVKNVNNESIYA